MPPALIVSVLFGSLYALLFHLLVGKSKRPVWQYWLVSVAGFVAAQVVAMYTPFFDTTLGDVHVIEGSLFCWVCLFILHNRK